MPFTTKDWRDAPGDLTTPISAAAMEDLEARLAAYTDAVAGAVPPAAPSGLVQWTAAPAAPTGWLVANGQTVSRTTYAALYAALGGASSAWGQGNGSTTFTLPDLRDRAPVGSGTTYTLGSAVGASTVTLSAAEMPAHTHTGPSHTHTGPAHTHSISSDGNHVHGIIEATGAGGSWSDGTTAIYAPHNSTPSSGLVLTSSNGAHTHGGATGSGGTGATGASGTAATGSAGTGGAHANLPPSLALLPIIKT